MSFYSNFILKTTLFIYSNSFYLSRISMYLKNCLSFETFQLKSVLKHNSIQNRISLKNIFSNKYFVRECLQIQCTNKTVKSNFL